jgi:hypothetical protein
LPPSSPYAADWRNHFFQFLDVQFDLVGSFGFLFVLVGLCVHGFSLAVLVVVYRFYFGEAVILRPAGSPSLTPTLCRPHLLTPPIGAITSSNSSTYSSISSVALVCFSFWLVCAFIVSPLLFWQLFWSRRAWSCDQLLRHPFGEQRFAALIY